MVVYSPIHKAASSLVTGRSLQYGKMSMGNRRTEQPPDPILYSGRLSGGFVNSTVNHGGWWWFMVVHGGLTKWLLWSLFIPQVIVVFMVVHAFFVVSWWLVVVHSGSWWFFMVLW